MAHTLRSLALKGPQMQADPDNQLWPLLCKAPSAAHLDLAPRLDIVRPASRQHRRTPLLHCQSAGRKLLSGPSMPDPAKGSFRARTKMRKW